MEEGRNTERLTFGEALLVQEPGSVYPFAEQSLDPQLRSCLPTHKGCHT